MCVTEQCVRPMLRWIHRVLRVHVARVWVHYPDWGKQMVIVELVHEGTEQITLAEKVHSKKTEWQVHWHRRRKKCDVFHDSYIKLKGGGAGMVSLNSDRSFQMLCHWLGGFPLGLRNVRTTKGRTFMRGKIDDRETARDRRWYLCFLTCMKVQEYDYRLGIEFGELKNYVTQQSLPRTAFPWDDI